MQSEDFLRRVLGPEGWYCIVGLRKGGEFPIQKLYKELSQVCVTAEQLLKNGHDVYYATAEFLSGASRKAANVRQLKSFYLDLDCGPGKPYGTQQDAARALKSFCKKLGLPRPLVVNSGGGLHVYWPLTQPIPPEQWRRAARVLGKLCDMHDLYADPAVTTDCARILRLPGTLNFKGAEPREVAVLTEQAPETDPDEFIALLGEDDHPPFASTLPMDDTTTALLGNSTSRFRTILRKTMQGYGCAQLQHVVTQRATLPEPLWRAGISIAKFCVDADTAIHKISVGHPDYSPEATVEKAARIQGGPYTCAKFEELNPGGCDGCPHKGEIKSPIVLGREILAASDEDNIVEDVPAGMDEEHAQPYVIPQYPAPYFRGKNGGVYKRVTTPDGATDVLIYHNDLYATRRLMDAVAGESIVMRLHLPHDGVREFTIPLTLATSKEELRKQLSFQGVAAPKVDDLLWYTSTWVTHMQYAGTADTARRQMGWVDEECSAFVLGQREIRADRVDFNPPTATTAEYMAVFAPHGSYDEWRKAMDFYAQPGMELHQFVIGLGFGSIFTHFTPVNGALLHIYGDTGVGKTTAIEAAASIWGNPVLIRSKENDTVNATMLRAEVYRNLLLPIDEITNIEPKALSDFLYQYTSGMQRNRMSRSGNTTRQRGEPWHQVAVSTGNASMVDRISRYKALPKGELARLMEIRVDRHAGLSKEDGDAHALRLRENYGHAALPFLQYVMANAESMRAMHANMQRQLDGIFGFTPQDRFHSVLVANAIVGISVATQLGLINFALPPIIKWLKGVVAHAREAIVAVNQEDTPLQLLSRFLAENWNNVLRINDGGGPEDTSLEHLAHTDAQPRGALVARYEYDTKQLYIIPAELRRWCSDKQISFADLVDHLRLGGYGGRLVTRRLSKGTRMSMPPGRVLQIDCTAFSEMVDDACNPPAEAAQAA